MMRGIGHAVALLSVLLVSSCVFLDWMWQGPPPVPLTSGLPRETALMSGAFNSRVRDRFPLGMLARDVAVDLNAQGFKQADGDGQPSGKHSARRYDGGAPVCDLEAVVSWQSGEDGRLQAVDGSYFVTCL